MSLLGNLTSGIRSLFRKEQVDRELDEDLRGFLDMAVEEKLKQGLSRTEAARAVRLERGSLDGAKETVREAGWEHFLETCWQDLRYGLRMLRKSPGFTLVAACTLAFGIAGTATLWSIFDGAYIHFGETEQANRVVLLLQDLNNRSGTSRFSAPEYFEIANLKRYQSFDGFFAMQSVAATLSKGSAQSANPEFVRVVRLTANTFPLYGFAAMVGRTFTPDEDRPGAQNVAVLTYRLWDARFAQNPNVIGQTTYLDGVPYTIIGVTPRRSQHWGADVYIPLKLDPVSNNRRERQIEYWQDISELSKPITPEIYVPLWQHPEAVRDLKLLVRTAVDPSTVTGAVRREALLIDSERPAYSIDTLQELADNALGPTRVCLLILGTFAGIALLTACVGLYAVVSYSVAQRTQEIGVRIALGAKQRDVLRLVAREGVPVIGVGLLVGLVSSLGLTRLMSSIVYGVSATDGATLLAVSGILTATAILAVYIPARRAMRVDPMVALRYE